MYSTLTGHALDMRDLMGTVRDKPRKIKAHAPTPKLTGAVQRYGTDSSSNGWSIEHGQVSPLRLRIERFRKRHPDYSYLAAWCVVTDRLWRQNPNHADLPRDYVAPTV